MSDTLPHRSLANTGVFSSAKAEEKKRATEEKKRLAEEKKRRKGTETTIKKRQVLHPRLTSPRAEILSWFQPRRRARLHCPVDPPADKVLNRSMSESHAAMCFTSIHDGAGSAVSLEQR